MPEAKACIRDALGNFASGGLRRRATRLLEVMGYHSERTINAGQVSEFLETFNAHDVLTQPQRKLFEAWRQVDIIFQYHEGELREALHAQDNLFGSRNFEPSQVRSFLFLAVELAAGDYPRYRLAKMTRAVNRLLPMPVLVFFRYVHDNEEIPSLSLAVIHRRAHKLDVDKDVLEKVTLIKDIRVANPHRAHVDILESLTLHKLADDQATCSFDALHANWEDRLDTEALNKRFYRELFAWFQSAVGECRFPYDGEGEGSKERQVIRLITRILFIWFLKEMGLVPRDLFQEAFVGRALRQHEPEGTDYYRAVLQNLFFGSLNTEIERRAFSRRDRSPDRDFTKCRYKDLLSDPEGFLKKLKSVPFVNGGLFDCLDHFESQSRGDRRIDAFTDNIKGPGHGRELDVPARIFFGKEGLFPLLHRYKFTVEENTPLHQEVALDPELLGRVFENLLATYNPETKDIARKATGSYYTPRPVVEEMVDGALAAYFLEKVPPPDGNNDRLKERIEHLLAYNRGEGTQGAEVGPGEPEGTSSDHLLKPGEVGRLIDAIDDLKILDPACGSGAFPMAILQKLVFVLSKVDPENQRWKARQLETAHGIPDPLARKRAKAAIEAAFSPARNYGDFGRKRYLIQRVIHGVDIQPIACQIAKLRFFISLLVEQKTNEDPADNYGIEPLPNLETRFVSADTLGSLPASEQGSFRSPGVERLEKALRRIRAKWFEARDRDEKLRLKGEDERTRETLIATRVRGGWDEEAAERLARWDPYDQNRSADWFDPAWMFGVDAGFAIVIGNPPYIQLEKDKGKLANRYQNGGYATFTRKADVYQLFYERGCQLLRPWGHLSYITSNSWLKAEYGGPLRRYLSEEHTPLLLVDGAKNVFAKAIVVTSRLLVREGGSAKSFRARNLDNSPSNHPPPPPPPENWKEARPDGDAPWSILSPTEWRVVDKMRTLGTPLAEWDVKINYGIKTGCNKAFIIDANTRDALIGEDPHSAQVLKPVLRGRDVKRWRAEWAGLWLIYARKGTRLEGYPAVARHLEAHRTALAKKSGGNRWYELQGSPSAAAAFRYEQEKLFWMDMAPEGRFAYAEEPMYCNNSAFTMTNGPLHYLCAVLNSALITWFLKNTALTSGMGVPRWIKGTVERLPIPAVSTDAQAPLIRRVKEILTAKDADPAVDIGALEAEIDRRVYALYDLDEEEIKTVEKARSGEALKAPDGCVTAPKIAPGDGSPPPSGKTRQ